MQTGRVWMGEYISPPCILPVRHGQFDMVILALDTTTASGTIALMRADETVTAEPGDSARTHGERLPGDLVRFRFEIIDRRPQRRDIAGRCKIAVFQMRHRLGIPKA